MLHLAGDHGLDSRSGDTLIPIQELFDSYTLVEVVEKDRYGHPGPSEYPRSAEAIRMALNSVTSFPDRLTGHRVPFGSLYLLFILQSRCDISLRSSRAAAASTMAGPSQWEEVTVRDEHGPDSDPHADRRWATPVLMILAFAALATMALVTFNRRVNEIAALPPGELVQQFDATMAVMVGVAVFLVSFVVLFSAVNAWSRRGEGPLWRTVVIVCFDLGCVAWILFYAWDQPFTPVIALGGCLASVGLPILRRRRVRQSATGHPV